MLTGLTPQELASGHLYPTGEIREPIDLCHLFFSMSGGARAGYINQLADLQDKCVCLTASLFQ